MLSFCAVFNVLVAIHAAAHPAGLALSYALAGFILWMLALRVAMHSMADQQAALVNEIVK